MREESGAAPGLADLPTGGGGVSALGDRFQPDLVRGSGGYAIAISCPKGPNELQPSLTLSYSTGSGNGAFGLGWRLSVMRIERRSDRGIPEYAESDTFVLGDAEVLVPVGGNRYRPKTDTKFWKIERVDNAWRIQRGDGRTMRFGQTAASRERDGARVFAWYLDEEQDAAGNSISYVYRQDQNRLYLDEIRYSIFRIRVLYQPRPDPIRNGRSGFARVTALRAHAIEVHCDRLAPTLMRTYTLTYVQAQNGASLLTRCVLSATDGAVTAKAPELTFEYSTTDFGVSRVHEVQSAIALPSLDHPATQLVDMSGDGLPDVLRSFGSRMLLWRNRGDGSLTGPTAIEGVPSTVSLDRANVALADLDGDGRVDLFAVDQPLQLAFVSNGHGGFEPDPVVFRNRPSLRLSAPDTRLMDIDGDGVTDLLSAGRNYLLLFRHVTGQGWTEPNAVARIPDLDRFPDVNLQDRGVELADMTGDGLEDILVVRSGDVSYWPYLGNGVWGNRVVMENPPHFPPGYRDDRVRVIDLDGDGCADILYFDNDRTLIWLNQLGVSFAGPIENPVAPRLGSTHILAADFFGDGKVGFLWTATASAQNSAGYRFLRFDEGRRPYLLTTISNGMGRQTTIEYATSTVMRLHDEEHGEDWQGQLPFVAPVVSAIRDRDSISGVRSGIAIHYHDGVYDGREREFRGFMRTTVEMAGDDSIPALRQEYRFFQGDPDEPNLVARERQRALSGSFESLRTFEQTAAGFELRHESEQTWDARVEFDDTHRRVFFPFLTHIENREHSPAASPSRIERTQFLDYDAHGNAARRIREYAAEGDPPARTIRSDQRFFYTHDEVMWLVKLPVRSELRDSGGVPLAITIHTYDGPAFTGLPEGQADKGLLTRTQELLLLESRLPADYVGIRDFAPLGYTLMGSGDTRGYYATKQSFRRDSRGNVIEQQDALGSPSQITYDADGVFPIERTDSLGKLTKIDFQVSSGEPRRVVLPDGRQFRFEFDPLGRLVAQFEADDAGQEQLVKCWQLDLGSVPVAVTSFTPQAGGRTVVDFVAVADLTALRDVYVSREYLDGFGKTMLKITTGSDGIGDDRRFVASGQLLSNGRHMLAADFSPSFVPGFAFVATPSLASARLRHRYDAQGHVAETLGPGPAHFRFSRDTFTLEHFEGANAGAFGAPAPAGPPSRVEFFDACDRIVRIEEARGDGTTIRTSYDLAGDNRIAVIRGDDGNEVVRYTFAGPGDAIRIAHRDAGDRTYYRDASGRLVELIRADGSRLFYRYDAVGRLVNIEHTPPGPGGASSVVRQLFYDTDPSAASAGRFLDERVALVREGGNDVRYSYNRNGSILREEITGGGTSLTASREYNLRQEITAIVYPDGRRVEYVRDASGAIISIPGVVTQALYAEDGQIDSYTAVNGVRSTFAREAVSRRLTQISAVRNGATLRGIAYTHDDIGNIVGLHDEMPGSVEHQTFSYDGLHRLTHFEARDSNALGPIRRAETYAYGAQGDIRQIGSDTLEYADSAHPGRVTRILDAGGGHAMSYTARGAIRAWADSINIAYDSLDRVSQVTRTDGVELQFVYDAQNRRLLKHTIAGGQTRTVRYASHLYEQHEAHSVRHIYLDDRLVASETVTAAGTQPVFFLFDHHGTIVLGANAAGAVVQNQRYSPFGLAVGSNVPLDRYLGIERDAEMGLLHFGARCYSPAIGRFISPDWFVLENPTLPVHMPQGFNAYSYALNNPLAFKDPSGKWFFLVPFVVGFVSGLIYGLADGQKWDAFGTALETGLTTGFGAMLGGLTAGSFVSFGGMFGAVMGGVNGLFTGLRKTYDWSSIEGWASFASDSTWGIVGTSLGNLLNVVNLVAAGPSYDRTTSMRQNRQVYNRGFNFTGGDTAFSQGNVISNLDRGVSGSGAKILKHERTHLLQNRIFGPLYIGSSVVWYANAIAYSIHLWWNDNKNVQETITRVGHDKNPWEKWASEYDPPGG